MTILTSEVYNVTLKKGIRGKAKDGFIRPTLGEMFKTERDFKEVSKIILMQPTYFGGVQNATLTNNNLTATSNDTWKYAWLKGSKTGGKWYVEFKLNADGGVGPWAGLIDPDTVSNTYAYNLSNSLHFASGENAGSFYLQAGWYNGARVNWDIGSYLGLAFDMDTYTLDAYINGTKMSTFQETDAARKLSKFTFDFAAVFGGQVTVTPTATAVNYPIPYGFIYYGE